MPIDTLHTIIIYSNKINEFQFHPYDLENCRLGIIAAYQLEIITKKIPQIKELI